MFTIDSAMSIDSHPPTTNPDVNAVLSLLLSNVRSILRERFVGLYLYGSLASGDFEPHSSDIDFVVVTTDSLPDEIITALKEMHAHLIASGLKWAAKLEGSYITRSALRRYNSTDGPFPCVNEGEFYLAHHESHWIIQRHILREQGVVIAGPKPTALIDPVERNDIQQAILGFLHEWWSPMLAKPARLQSTEYQAYAVLTMCRALYTLETGTNASKPAAAHWAQITLGEPWSELIHWALTWQTEPPLNRMNETLDFIKYILDRSRQDET
jgi:predicted nucleotidyltransferase